MGLATKKASILAEQQRYGEALSYIDQEMKNNNNTQLRQLYSDLQVEAARAENRRDPYVLYGRVFESSKSDESLDYLLNTSITRGYNEDALYYLDIAK